MQMPDITRAAELTPEVSAAIEHAFAYHPWGDEQRKSGELVRTALAAAVKVIVAECPPSANRTRAINMCIDARMLANAAITFR